jgi:hypothetical protein
MNTLRGRSIGLKAAMSAKEMEKHILEVKQNWIQEGHSVNDVVNAILSKVNPLISGFYWKRFPDACQRLSQVMLKLKFPVDRPHNKVLNEEHNQKTLDNMDDSAKTVKKISTRHLAEQFDFALK